jgi:hypothetical protein
VRGKSIGAEGQATGERADEHIDAVFADTHQESRRSNLVGKGPEAEDELRHERIGWIANDASGASARLYEEADCITGFRSLHAGRISSVPVPSHYAPDFAFLFFCILPLEPMSPAQQIGIGCNQRGRMCNRRCGN